MATEIGLFKDLSLVLLVAGAAALLSYWLRQPLVLGYLVAGFMLGPNSPGPVLVADDGVIRFLGDIGIVFLLFALGLEFSLSKLKRVGATAILIGTLEIGLMLWLGYSLGQWFGWGHLESVFLGAVMSISSTTVIVKVLSDRGEKDEEWASMAFGILIIEDILAVLILTTLSSASVTGNFQPELLGDLLVKLAIFLGMALVVGLMLAPRLVDHLSRSTVAELPVVVSAGAGFGLALLATTLGFSAGLGAFVAGALMAESPRVARIEHQVAPLRDVFTAIFFVTVGALIDPAVLLANWPLVLAAVAAVIAGKVVAVSLAMILTGHPSARALKVGLTLAQIGEFSFIIAALGADLGVTPDILYPLAVAVCVTTTFLTPLLIRSADPLSAWISRGSPTGVKMFATSYRAWLGRLRGSHRQAPEWRVVRSSLFVVGLCAASLAGLVALDVTLREAIRGSAAGFGVPQAGVFAAEVVLVALAAAPFLVVGYNAQRRLVVALAHVAVPQKLRGTECTTTERLLRRTFGLLAAILTGAFMLLAITPLLGAGYALLLVIVGVGVNTFLFGQSLSRYHREVEATVSRIVATRGGDASPEAKAEALTAFSDARAWGAASREVAIPVVSGGSGRTLGDLRLRALTGASVVRVTRPSPGDPLVMNPGAEFRFTAGDRVLLVGEHEAILRAEEILLGQELGVEGGATEIEVPEGSSVAGRTIETLHLRERSGVQILLLRRDANPLPIEPALRLRARDVLVVAGTEAEVTRLKGILAASSAVAEEVPS